MVLVDEKGILAAGGGGNMASLLLAKALGGPALFAFVSPSPSRRSSRCWRSGPDGAARCRGISRGEAQAVETDKRMAFARMRV